MGKIILITFNRVSYSYSAAPALTDINMKIGAGERLALMGANGSGKSTLAMLVKGLIPPDEGEILVDEIPPEKTHPGKVGLVFQNPENQLVASTAEREVAFGLENIGLPRAEMIIRMNEAFAVFGLEPFRKHPPHLLSGGQMQKLALASVFAMKPDYLILDEPTALLDPRSRDEFRCSLDKLPLNTGIMFITQNPAESLDYNRLVVLAKGRIIYDGSTGGFFFHNKLMKEAGIEPPLRYRFKAHLEA